MTKLLLLLVVAVAFALPLFSGIGMPSSLEPQAIGHFFQQIGDYWSNVFAAMGR